MARAGEGVGISRIHPAPWDGMVQLLTPVYLLKEVVCTVSGACKHVCIGDPQRN